MTTLESARRRPLRLWPGIAAAILLVLVRFGVALVIPDATILGVLGAMACAVAIIIWWLFFSRAPWIERIGALLFLVAAIVVTSRLVHESIRTGMMDRMFFVYAAPIITLALVVWAVFARRLMGVRRAVALVVLIFVACGAWMFLRTDGVTGDGVSQFAWRWTLTAEQRLLAQGTDATIEPAAAPAIDPVRDKSPDPAPASPKPSEKVPADPKVSLTAKERDDRTALPASADAKPEAAKAADAGTRATWPAFRGPDRDGIVRGVRIETDWSKAAPQEMWRRPVGPGWSSFAVQGDVLYTQEQRGDHELVASYRVSTGQPVWRHADAVRFWESNGGAGPRATPTLSGERLYTLGATGILNALDARTGAVVWSRNAASDTGANVPYWGFSSSPVVLDDMVIVYVGALAAYDRRTGQPRWVGKTRSGSYSSPHLATIDGVTQIVQLNAAGAKGVAPADGTELWAHAWEGTAIVQPTVLPDGDVLMASGDAMGGLGVRRIAVTRGSGGWTVEERWTSRGLKPYFNDFVVNKGHAFGFDGRILSCIDLTTGERKWKGGRYGQGQLVLLPEQDILLVLSEEGEIALVGAGTEQFTEIARLPAIEGKTWNHPVLARDVLLVRNGQEMAAFRLSLAGR